MADITKLPALWRDFEFKGPTHIGPLWHAGYSDCLSDVANQLEAALPKWTKITEDESTWPDADMFPVLIVWQQDSSVHVHEAHNTAEIGDKWRPLCSIDYPPKESE